MSNPTDADLLKQYALTRSPDAFAELVRRHSSLIYAVARRLTGGNADALDVTQSCFLDLARKADVVNGSVVAWLHSAATFRATDVIRRRDARRQHEQAAAVVRSQMAGTGKDWAEIEPRVDATIAALDDELREPLILHFLQGHSQADVAARLGVSQSTISRRLERGVECLRAKLGPTLACSALTAMLAEHAVAPAAPAAVWGSLGKMMVAGPGGSAPTRSTPVNLKGILAIVFVLIGLTFMLVLCMKATHPRITGTNTATSQRSNTMSASSGSTLVKREGGRVWIEGIPPLQWGQSGETTFCGALAAALAPSDRPRTYSTLMGDTAVAFRVRWYRPDAGANWSGAAPIGEQAEERQRIAAALGVPVEITWCNADNPARPQVVSRIVQAIDSGSPVLAYLSPHKDVAVVYGYADDGRTVLVRDYYDKPGGETAHPVSQLGSFFVFLSQPISPAREPRDACVTACRAAVQNWYRVDHPRFDEEGSFAYGDQAYAQWEQDIGSCDTFTPERRSQLFFVSSWNLNCLNDARLAAAKYLRANAPAFSGDTRAAVERAASLCERIAQVTGGPTWGEKAVFLGPWSGKTIDDWTPAVRQREIQILKDTRVLDRTVAALLARIPTQDQAFADEADPNFSALYQALKQADDPACQQLIREHPQLVSEVDWHTSPAVTALHWACWFDRVAVIDALLDAGADANRLDGYYLVTPMEWAHFNGKSAAMNRMEARGARIDLRMAARFNRIDLVQKLLQLPGIDKNAIGTDCFEGSVCLAVLNNNPAILKLLLGGGADARAANAGMETPLHQAAAAGNLECARLLLAHGADANALNLQGQTPLRLASNGGHGELAELLRQHGARE